MEMNHGTADEMRGFFAELLGDDWEPQFVLAGAIAGPEATNDDVDLANERAVIYAEERRPDLVWSAELRQTVREAWFGLWLQWEEDA